MSAATCGGCADPVNHPHAFDCPALAAEHEHPTLEALLECEAAECVELLTPGRRVVLAGKIGPLFGGEHGESLAEVRALAANGSVKRSRVWSPLALRRRALTEALAAHHTLTTL